MSEVGRIVGVMEVQDEATPVIGKFNAAAQSLFGTLDQLGGGFASFGNVASAAFSGFATGGPIGAAIGAGAAGMGQLVGYLQDSVKEAAASEQAMKNLAVAVEKSGTSWDAVKTGTTEALAALQKVTVFSDEETAAALQRLLTTGLSYEQAMKSLGATVDFAAARHLDLNTAATIVGKAIEGNASLLGRYGVNVDESALKSQGFTAVLDELNKQFGGTAAEQAKTYAGTQERLKNAMSELSEKVGGMLLPALTSITEGMIPVADAFASGIIKIQSWMDAVSKLPEVKGFVDAAGTAFAGLNKYFADTWNAVSKDLMPALDELWSAFKDIGEALKPLWDAFAEIMSAFSESGESIDPLKILLEGLVLAIKGIAAGIKLVVPIIKTFAEGFKLAADIITPPLRIIVEAVGGFIKFLSDTFQGFYDWLVGHSLWQDLWDTVVRIAGSIGGQLKAILDSAFELWKSTFTMGMEAIKTIITTGFDLAFAVSQAIIQGAVTILMSIVQPFVNLLSQGQKTWADLVASVALNVGDMKAKIQSLWEWAVPYWTAKVGDLAVATATKLDELNAKITTATQQMKTTWQSTLDVMVSSTHSAFQTMVNDIGQQVDAIISRLRAAQSQITTHSIWPDMLGNMVAQTKDAMATIRDEFSNTIIAPGGIIPTIEAGVPTATPTPATPGSSGAAAFSGSQELTLPIHIYLDGQEIQTFLERRIVDTLSRDASRAKRG